MYGQTDGISPHSAGLCPLLGLLPKKALRGLALSCLGLALTSLGLVVAFPGLAWAFLGQGEASPGLAKAFRAWLLPPRA